MKKINNILLITCVFMLASYGPYHFGERSSHNLTVLKTELANSTSDMESFLPLVMNNFASGFDCDFNTSAAGWYSHPDNWKWMLVDGEYYSNTGLPGAWVSTSYATPYTNFDYHVVLRRIGCAGCPYGLIVRGKPTPLGEGNRWDSGYGFYITLSGYYGVFEYIDGEAITLQDWETSTNINQGENDWNTLRIRAVGDKLEFYINDSNNLFSPGVDSTYPSGKVGISMFTKSDSISDQIWVDKATLTQY